jgi:hypothetical protein
MWRMKRTSAAVPEHVHEIFGVAQLRFGRDVVEALAVTVAVGGDDGDFADDAADAVDLDFGVADVFGVGIEGGERGEGADEHAHGMGVVAEAFHEFLDVLEDAHVDAEGGLPLLLLLGRGEFAVDDEVGDLGEGAVLGEVGDIVAAVAEDSLVAVDERDLALAGGGVHEGGVVGHHAEVVGLDFNLAQIHRTNRVVGDGEGVLLSRAIVDQGNRILHGTSLRWVNHPLPPYRLAVMLVTVDGVGKLLGFWANGPEAVTDYRQDWDAEVDGFAGEGGEWRGWRA